MDLIQGFMDKARRNPPTIVYPEGGDARIVVSAARVRELGIARPVLLGVDEDIRRMAADEGVSLDGVELASIGDEARLEKYAAAYAETRGVRERVARKVVAKPLAFAGMMVRMGDAGGMVAGVQNATASVIQVASLTIGFQEGLSTPSSFFIMIIPEFEGQVDYPLIFADCAVNIAPDARQLAEIGVASGTSAKTLLGIEPRIAFLSFSTKASASHGDADKVIEAAKIAGDMGTGFAIDGELQADAAIVARVAAKKVKESSVAGSANVLVFPDLDAGNICYKLVQYLANAKAIGPVLQGFARPVSDLSRGASVEDITAVTAIVAVQAQG